MALQDFFYTYKISSKGVNWLAYCQESTSSYYNVSIQVNKRVFIISLPTKLVEKLKHAIPRIAQRHKTDFK
jgi:hypothetical protein